MGLLHDPRKDPRRRSVRPAGWVVFPDQEMISASSRRRPGRRRFYQFDPGEIMIALLSAALFSLVVLANLAAGAAPAAAPDDPNRPVRWLIGFSAGGPVDIVARIMGQWLSEHFGQQFVVENRAGAGGNLATATAINSTPDGYTLLFAGANNAISASLYKHLAFDFMRDTVPVAAIMRLTNMMVISNAMPVKSVQEFIDYCKANPGKVAYASSGNGTTVHMAAE